MPIAALMSAPPMMMTAKRRVLTSAHGSRYLPACCELRSADQRPRARVHDPAGLEPASLLERAHRRLRHGRVPPMDLQVRAERDQLLLQVPDVRSDITELERWSRAR